MLETKEIKPIFGRHEGFYPKINHFKKLVDAVENDPKLFQSDDAALMLGIKKSQLKALKYWGLAFNIIKEEDKKVFLTGLKFSLSNDGDDPYLEKNVTIGLLNGMLQGLPNITPSWYFFFNEFKQVEFSAEDLARSIKIWSEEVFPDVEISEKTINKDAECIIKMYTENIPENPFCKLGVIQDRGGYYAINRGGIWLQTLN